MSLQDDYFDIKEALKNKPELKAFERFAEALFSLEEAHAEKKAILEGLRTGVQAFKKLMEGAAK